MQPICLYTGDAQHSPGVVFEARIAGLDLLIDQDIPEIESTESKRSMPELLTLADANASTFAGQGWLGERVQQFESFYSTQGQTVAFEGGARFHVNAAGNRVSVLNPAAPSESLEVLLGPALLLAMARRDRFALHAASVLGESGACLFLGPSGAGKSTLAGGLGRSGLTRCTDDVTPVYLQDSNPIVLPRFPQLKLQPVLQTRDIAPPLAALIWPRLGNTEPGLSPVNAMMASQMLVRDTAAARLFAPDLLARHLRWCSELAQRIPTWRLDVPVVGAQDRQCLYSELVRILREHGLA